DLFVFHSSLSLNLAGTATPIVASRQVWSQRGRVEPVGGAALPHPKGGASKAAPLEYTPPEQENAAKKTRYLHLIS
ncbi:hypothetical protein QRX35_22885, partial [Escherichia coli]|uniref:hypothetical protein n=1 Tax=Escherichia coli TaxID=562 RepID=UPI002DBCCF96